MVTFSHASIRNANPGVGGQWAVHETRTTELTLGRELHVLAWLAYLLRLCTSLVHQRTLCHRYTYFSSFHAVVHAICFHVVTYILMVPDNHLFLFSHPARGTPFVCNRSWHLPGKLKLVWHPARLIKEGGCEDLFYGSAASKWSLGPLWIRRLSSYSPPFSSFT